MLPAAPVVLLQCPDASDGEFLLFAEPREIICANLGDRMADAFARLEAARAAGFHLAGWLSYELAYLLQPHKDRLYEHNFPLDLPLLWFGVFDPPQKIARAELSAQHRAYAGPLRYEWTATEYRHGFEDVQRYIRAGDIYQANLTFNSYITFAGDPFALWLDLFDAAAVRHAAFIDVSGFQILSLSPELHFSVSATREMECRPMKGTCPRGKDPHTDEQNRLALKASIKDRAENLMIVDLMRNDMARVAETGSVSVPELFRVETYPSLHTMISIVQAKLRQDVVISELIKALFPCGSVTGAPKLRAMEIIRQVESSPRGVYCGSIGHFAPDGSASFNVAIRTMVIEGNRGLLGIGGGVVHDSTAKSEYAECLLKAKFLERGRKKLRLIETLRYSEGFVDLDRHLVRLWDSERILFWHPSNTIAARDALYAAVAGLDGDLRVRLMLDEKRKFTATAEPLAPNAANWKFAISPERVDSGDIFLRHKTDWRDLYDRESARAMREGIDEIVFLNERGELTEGGRTNLFVRKNGKLVTPPLACGLLPGILRGKLLESGECAEETLYLDDLDTAQEIYLGNSLRGLMRAVLVKQ
jgi:para-aminobenzoate synthetase/4-amino-4-deoxychorismate lyase